MTTGRFCNELKKVYDERMSLACCVIGLAQIVVRSHTGDGARVV